MNQPAGSIFLANRGSVLGANQHSTRGWAEVTTTATTAKKNWLWYTIPTAARNIYRFAIPID